MFLNAYFLDFFFPVAFVVYAVYFQAFPFKSVLFAPFVLRKHRAYNYYYFFSMSGHILCWQVEQKKSQSFLFKWIFPSSLNLFGDDLSLNIYQQVIYFAGTNLVLFAHSLWQTTHNVDVVTPKAKEWW